MNNDKMEKLAFLQALYNVIGKAVATKNPDNLRGEVDDAFKALYEATGAKSFDVKIGDEKVGTYSFTISKPTDERIDESFGVIDHGELFCWKVDEEMAVAFARDRLKDYAAWYFDQTGEMAPGCALIETRTPGDPGGRVKSTTLRIDPAKVADAMGERLGSAVRALLEEAEDD